MGMAHGGGRTAVNAALVATEAVAVTKAVRHQTLALGGQLCLQLQPGLLTVQIGLEAIRVTISTFQWRQEERLVLPSLQ